MTLANPFQDPLRFERRVPECTVVIFGANGELTKRKLMPTLYRLMYERRLSPGFAVVGLSRTPMSDDQFREKMRESVQIHAGPPGHALRNRINLIQRADRPRTRA